MMSRRTRFPVAVCILGGFGLLLASCDKDTPTSPPPSGPSAPPVVLVRVEATVPSDIAPGQSVQLAAQAVNSDGSREDVSARAQWTSSAPDVLDVSATGLASARRPGESIVTVRLGTPSATARVIVVPPGTYRLGGQTHEFGTPLPDVSIEVLEGVGTGLKTRSGSDGSYVLYGVSGPVRLHLKKDGFVNKAMDVTVSSHQTRDVGLESSTGYPAYTGTYTLVVTAVAPCSGPFPDAARRRVYTAHMKQVSSALSVKVSDADFILTRGFGNAFSGGTTGGGVYFDLRRSNWYYYYYSAPEYQLVERLTANSAIVVHGSAEGNGPASHLRGRMGTISVTARMSAPHDPFAASCNAEFEMIRR